MTQMKKFLSISALSALIALSPSCKPDEITGALDSFQLTLNSDIFNYRLTLELVDDRFYHLDTCLQLVDEQTALFVPSAFTAEGVRLLEKAFPRLVEVPEDEALHGLACNGHCPDGTHFIVHRGATKTLAEVRRLGLTPIEVDTSEFLKSGGSVYCMKLMVP